MDIHEIRQKIKISSIYDIPMRVTFYARVSSEKDEQLNSLDNQISYYTDLIKSNKKWTYINGYIDEGISGISTQKRENFHQMIADAKIGMFDLIITKEISRFARNTLDSIKYTRELLNDGVGVFFQNDNINTLDEDNETAKAIAELDKTIAFETKKKQKLLDYNINGDISDKDFIKMNNDAIKKIERAEAEKFELENRLNSETEFKAHIREIKETLEKAAEEAADGVIDTAFINKYIDKIFVSAEENTLKLDIKIFTGETCEKYLKKIRKIAKDKSESGDFRSGQMALTI